jgi:hypothetical protein
MAAYQMLQPKPRKLMTVGPDQSVLDESDPTKPLFTAPGKPAAQPTSVQEYLYAQQNPAFNDWDTSRRRAGAANVSLGGGQKDANWGTPPKDRVWARDASGNVMVEPDAKTGAFRPIAVPIGGSDAAADLEKLDTRAAGSAKQAGAVLETVREASNLVSGWNTGPMGTLAGVPATEAKKLSGLLTTIKANLGFDRLQQMRDQSPTGGALGHVAVQELASLQATVAALDQLQKPSDLKAGLEKVAQHYKAWEATLGGKNSTPDHVRKYNPATGRIE